MSDFLILTLAVIRAVGSFLQLGGSTLQETLFPLQLKLKFKRLRLKSVGSFWYCFHKCFQDLIRSSRPKLFCKKGVLRNFAKFTGKHVCKSLFFSKVAGLRPATLSKKRLWYRCFPMNFENFLRTPFIIEKLRWLLLSYIHFFNWLSLWNLLNNYSTEIFV